MHAPKNISLNSKIAGCVFDDAATKSQKAIILEILAGLTMAVPAIFHGSLHLEITCAVLAVIFFAVAKAVKIAGERQQSLAGSIRRISDFADGLGLAVTNLQQSKIEELAGAEIVERAQSSTDDNRGYASTLPPGPKRLCEMRIEAAFWSAQIHKFAANKIRNVAISFSILASGIIVAGTLPALRGESASGVIFSMYLILPAVVATDIVGWIFKSNELSREVASILHALVALAKERNVSEVDVLRLVADYDSLIANGIPLPKWFFQQCRAEIQTAWNRARLLE